jgi:hypothetical protein
MPKGPQVHKMLAALVLRDAVIAHFPLGNSSTKVETKKWGLKIRVQVARPQPDSGSCGEQDCEILCVRWTIVNCYRKASWGFIPV